jgi:hypothetical protein
MSPQVNVLFGTKHLAIDIVTTPLNPCEPRFIAR